LNSPAVFVVTRTLKILVNMLAHVSQVANVVLRKSIEIPKIDGFEQTQPTGPFAVLYHLPRCNHEQMNDLRKPNRCVFRTSIHYLSRGVHTATLSTKNGHSAGCSMQKVRKTAAELEAIVRAEAVRVIGPWPVGLRMLIYPLGDNWRATFSLEHLGLADYRDDVLPIVLRLRNEFDIIEL